jgi:glutaminase
VYARPMTTAGFHETSGECFYDIGLPEKSGIAGTVTVVPSKSGLDLFLSKPEA